ncbi:uncharacterized protein VTP21DRAFT_1116 [Calcarisporiella thermophila]|uniref:uncharacterized protein n=1 Tax=Calcarisporiella thermophila TaxID=911321 RepID=UPI003743973C
MSLKRCVGVVKEKLLTVPEEDSSHPLAGVKGIYLLADEYDAFSNEYLNIDNHDAWEALCEKKQSLLKGFWACVKQKRGLRQIYKCFITGVTPLSLADHTSGFNIATNVSDEYELSGLCGLSKEEALAALHLPGMCNSPHEVKERFQYMEYNFNGYLFSPSSEVSCVFNTNTCLEYFQRLRRKGPVESFDPSNSETSERLLQILASSPNSITILENITSQIDATSDNTTWDAKIPYESLKSEFSFSHLMGTEKSEAAWLSFMRYIGGLTYDSQRPEKYLRIPNNITLKQFALAILDRYQLRVTDIESALQSIASSGNILHLMSCYQRLMSSRDVGYDDFKKNEEQHRDSLYFSVFKNPLLRQRSVEFRITKANGQNGRVELLIEIPTTKHVVIIEFKVIQIDYLDIRSALEVSGHERGRKAYTLGEINDTDALLNLKFNRRDRFRPGQTIKEWVQSNDGPYEQLSSYWNSREIKNLRDKYTAFAYLVIIIGSRKILIWNMADSSKFSEPMLGMI